MGGTVLSLQLTDGTSRRPTALDAFKIARRRFIAGERIEMQSLSRQFGVSRVTLHRCVRSRDLLLGEILWSLGKPAFDSARERTASAGGRAVADAVECFLEDVLPGRQDR